MPGTNAKMNEMQALMGSMILGHISDLIEKRKLITSLYREKLTGISGLQLVPECSPDVHENHAYMPREVNEEEIGVSRDCLYEELKEFSVLARRYSYPMICDYACYNSVSVKDPLVVARKVADRILTLPIYSGLASDAVERICSVVKKRRSQANDQR